MTLKIETQWLREFAHTYLPSEAAVEFNPEAMRKAGVTLVDIINLFRRGRVTYSDKREGVGAVWVVEGADCDDVPLTATLVVATQELSIDIRSLERAKGPNDDAA